MKREIALITGASSGIGAEFAGQLATLGMDLVLVARRRDRLAAQSERLADEHGVSCTVLCKDLSRPEAAEDLFAETMERGLEVDWLVNNAGFGTRGRFSDLPLEREIEAIRLNVEALVALTRLFLPGMIERGRGQIVNVASTSAFQAMPYMATYAATKAFVLSFSEAIATETFRTGVNVIAVCPGLTRTEFQAVAGVGAKEMPDVFFLNAADVVRESIEAAREGRQVVVNGWMNRLALAGTQFIPRGILARATATVSRPKRR